MGSGFGQCNIHPLGAIGWERSSSGLGARHRFARASASRFPRKTLMPTRGPVALELAHLFSLECTHHSTAPELKKEAPS
jgi:hypothetical protein